MLRNSPDMAIAVKRQKIINKLLLMTLAMSVPLTTSMDGLSAAHAKLLDTRSSGKLLLGAESAILAGYSKTEESE